MTDLIAKLFDIGRLPSRIVAVVALVSGALLFLPERALQIVHTSELVSSHGPHLGLAFVASTALLALNVILWCGKGLTRSQRRRKRLADMTRELERLDPAEQAVLREFLFQQRDSLLLPVDEPSVAGLVRKGILDEVSTVGRRSLAGITFPLSIDSDLKERITPAHLGLSGAEPSHAEIERLTAGRPAFVRQIAKDEAWRGGI